MLLVAVFPLIYCHNHISSLSSKSVASARSIKINKDIAHSTTDMFQHFVIVMIYRSGLAAFSGLKSVVIFLNTCINKCLGPQNNRPNVRVLQGQVQDFWKGVSYIVR